MKCYEKLSVVLVFAFAAGCHVRISRTTGSSGTGLATSPPVTKVSESEWADRKVRVASELVKIAGEQHARAKQLASAGRLSNTELLGSEARLLQARLRVEEYRYELAQQVSKRAELANLNARLGIAKRLVEYRTLRVEECRSQVSNGTAPLDALGEAQRELTEARLRMLELEQESSLLREP